ncbi:lambda exonuclease family protein [Paeniglutamicibacter terrestris]|uniref:YqaJ viral recombinase family protein n=1 Tax=Paeniglutamicibacter terrestris TaxID=2723403 RepID=A0ABX1G890_9MICC|nr:lambda exonuclease family protein [Paeniglutamicibacter terrestris]NKG22239.1 YqaJ viral recombinase family protein [Paeniglutamicibacter terrestris]
MIKTGARKETPKQETPPVAISKTYVPPENPARAEPVDLTGTTLEVFNVDQGTEEWHAVRRGIVTASVMHALISSTTLNVSTGETAKSIHRLLAAERITNYTEPTATSRDMERGNLDEPYARDLYSETHAPAATAGFMIRTFAGFQIGYSPDGLVGDDGLIEIKSRAQKKHVEVVLAEDDVPAENMAQMQTGILVMGRKWCDYVDYTGGMALYVKRVFPDPAWQQAIIEAAKLFEASATQMISDYLEETKDAPIAERIDHFEEMEF